MYAVEQTVVNNEEYINFCKAMSSSNSSCDPDAYQSFSKNFAANIDTLTQNDVDTFLQNSVNVDNSLIYLEETFSQTNLVSKKARGIYLFASPIETESKRYDSYNVDEAKQRDELVKFSKDLIGEIKGISDDLKVQLYNSAWYEDKVDEYVMQDFTLAIFSFVFVLIYVSFHLKSIFLA